MCLGRLGFSESVAHQGCSDLVGLVLDSAIFAVIKATFCDCAPHVLLFVQIDGTFRINRPPVLLGYTSDPAMAATLRDGDVNTGVGDSDATYVTMFITIEPALQPAEPAIEKVSVKNCCSSFLLTSQSTTECQFCSDLSTSYAYSVSANMSSHSCMCCRGNAACFSTVCLERNFYSLVCLPTASWRHTRNVPGTV